MEPLSLEARRAAVAAAGWNGAVLVLTVVHHSYGAMRYDTPWRNHVSHLAGLVLLAMLASLLLASSRPGTPLGRIGRWSFLAIAWAGPVAWIGIFEGGYNHLAKLLLTAIQVPSGLFQAMYPPNIYEAPGDLIFELTGILQFGIALLGMAALLRYRRATRE